MDIELINVATKDWPITLAQFKAENPHTQLPDDPEILAQIDWNDLGYAVVVEEEKPVFDKLTQKIEPEIKVKNKAHKKTWKIVQLSAEHIAENKARDQAETIARYEKRLDDHLDSVAKSHRFADRHSLALRSGYPSAYQPLALAFGQWMDGCNILAYQRLQRVLDGDEQIPDIDEFISDLPVFVAP